MTLPKKKNEKAERKGEMTKRPDVRTTRGKYKVILLLVQCKERHHLIQY